MVIQQLYSTSLINSFPQQLLDASMFFNDRTSELPDGEVLHIDQLSDITLSPYAENSPLDFSSIDTSRIELRISDYDQDACYITDKLREDGVSKIPGLVSSRLRKSTQAFMTKIVSDVMATQSQQTAGDLNLINAQPHRFVASGGTDCSRKITLDDIRQLKLSFDEANIPAAGRILIVDPTVEFELNGLAQVVTSDNPRFEGLIETGFADRTGMQFYRKIYGFDIMISTTLPRVGAETSDGKSTGATGVANMALYVGDDEGKPFMGVVRKPPTAGNTRNDALQRDENWALSRWAFTLQRPVTLAFVLTAK